MDINTRQIATICIFIILLMAITFHMLILSEIIQFHMVWSGRLKNSIQMHTFETVFISINFVLLVVVAVKASFVKLKIYPRIIKIALWLMVGCFLLNTLGNILSNNQIERMVFTPVTFLLALFSFRLAIRQELKTIHRKGSISPPLYLNHNPFSLCPMIIAKAQI